MPFSWLDVPEIFKAVKGYSEALQCATQGNNDHISCLFAFSRTANKTVISNGYYTSHSKSIMWSRHFAAFTQSQKDLVKSWSTTMQV